MVSEIAKVLLTESQIHARLDEMAEEISLDYAGKELTAVAILNGSLVFLADLLRRIPLPLRVDCLPASSYRGTRSTGSVRIREDLMPDLAGRHVLLLDDILDTGLTLGAVRRQIASSASPAASVRTCVLLRKQTATPRDVGADYVGFDIPDEFVVGYGLDYNERYRNLPFIGVPTESALRTHANQS